MLLTQFFEAMYFHTKWYHYLLLLLLLPISMLYGLSMLLRRMFTQKVSYNLPIVSVGNLIVGGSGKTPFAIALAKRFDNVTIISRGYGRQSKGLLEISYEGKVLVDVQRSGDEAMLMAESLSRASVIVSEERHEAIKLAKSKGAKLIILDDGFNRVDIEKYEILLEPKQVNNTLPFPAGPFREFAFSSKYADVVLKEDKGFERLVEIDNATERMVLVTAIANPSRLEQYLPENVVSKVSYEDHAYFDEEELSRLLREHGATSILCTSKDRVKMRGFKLPVSEMKLKLEIKKEIITKIETYIKGYASA